MNQYPYEDRCRISQQSTDKLITTNHKKGKKKNHDDKAGYILGMQGWFNSQKQKHNPPY